MEIAGEKMRERQFFKWVKAHKVRLALAGISVAAIIYAVVRGKDIAELRSFLQGRISKVSGGVAADLPSCNMPKVYEAASPDLKIKRAYSSYSSAFTVKRHCRMLPAGQHPSAEKKAEALESGINLLQNQTLVNSYQKGVAA